MIKNIIANFIGKFWSLFSVFIFVPLYIDILGFDSYAIISFTLVIAGLMAVLDSGLTATLSREYAHSHNSEGDKYRILNTLESIYVFVIVVITIGLFSSSELIAEKWLNVEAFTPKEISCFIRLISFDVAFQMLFRFYLGGLMGLEKQVLANKIQVGWGVFRNGLVVLVIWFSPTLTTFFLWQATNTIIFALFLRFILTKELLGYSEYRLSFRVEKIILKKVWRFASGMMLITLVAALNSQMDKLTVSKLLPIDILGYYTLATSLAMGLVTIVTPLSIALLPRFTALYTEGKLAEAKKFFQTINTVTTILIFSLMATMVTYPKELLWVWTGNLELASFAGVFLPIIAVSFALLSLAIIPYNIAVANGYTKLNNILGLLSLFLTLPGYLFFTKSHGAMGAAVVFCIVQSVVTIIYYFFINKKYLGIAKSTLFLKGLIFPFIISLFTVWLISHVPFDFWQSRLLTLLWIGFSTTVCLTICSFIFIGRARLVIFKNILLKK